LLLHYFYSNYIHNGYIVSCAQTNLYGTLYKAGPEQLLVLFRFV